VAVTKDELVLMAAFADLNTRLARYITGFLDADHGHVERALSPEDERTLGARMVELGESLQRRSRGRGVVVIPEF
jgi:hypothetical protein